MHAYGLESLLDPIVNAHNAGRQPRVLDVGCGSGYLLGAFARLHNSRVVGLEHLKVWDYIVYFKIFGENRTYLSDLL